MAQSSILGGQAAPRQARGRDAETLGPSDSSDSGSDIQGESAFSTASESDGLLGTVPMQQDSDTDSSGTGERGSAVPERVRDGSDISTDRIEVNGITADDELSLDDPDALIAEELLLEDEVTEEDSDDTDD